MPLRCRVGGPWFESRDSRVGFHFFQVMAGMVYHGLGLQISVYNLNFETEVGRTFMENIHQDFQWSS